MKKILAVSLLTIMIILTFSLALEAFKSPYLEPPGGGGGSSDGHWIYNEHGSKVGCKSPGSDCTWS